MSTAHTDAVIGATLEAARAGFAAARG